MVILILLNIIPVIITKIKGILKTYPFAFLELHPLYPIEKRFLSLDQDL